MRNSYNEKVLETRQRVLGPDNNETLSIRSDLANNLDTQGNHAEAEKMEREVLGKAEADPGARECLHNRLHGYAGGDPDQRKTHGRGRGT